MPSEYIHRSIDYSAMPDPLSICGPIQGLLSRRQPQSMRQIQRWFRATPNAFVAAGVDRAVELGWIKMYRNGLSRRSGYVYSLDANSGWN